MVHIYTIAGLLLTENQVCFHVYSDWRRRFCKYSIGYLIFNVNTNDSMENRMA